MNVNRHHVIELLRHYKCDKFGIIHGKEVWASGTPDNYIIHLPVNGDIDFDLIEFIALEILNMGMWEFDYWLGQTGCSLN